MSVESTAVSCSLAVGVLSPPLGFYAEDSSTTTSGWLGLVGALELASSLASLALRSTSSILTLLLDGGALPCLSPRLCFTFTRFTLLRPQK